MALITGLLFRLESSASLFSLSRRSKEGRPLRCNLKSESWLDPPHLLLYTLILRYTNLHSLSETLESAGFKKVSLEPVPSELSFRARAVRFDLSFLYYMCERTVYSADV